MSVPVRATTKFRDAEDKLGMNERELRRNSTLKFASTLSLGSKAVKENLRSAIVLVANRTFGVELSQALSREKELLSEQSAKNHLVPRIVSQIVEYLKEHSIDTPGLFRIPGKHSEIIGASTAIDDGQTVNFEYLSRFDTHTVADLLKKYLRELPRPIIPVEKYFGAFMSAATIKEEDLLILYVASLVRILPEDYFNLLKYLCKFFWCLSQYSEETKMGTSNISIIFSPLFFGQSDSSQSTHLLLEAKYTSKLSKLMIDKYDSIFLAKHDAAQFMIARESILSGDFSLIKGEEIIVCKMVKIEGNDICFVNVNGRVAQIPKSLIDSKCEIITAPNLSKQLRSKSNIDEIRNEIIQRLLAITDDKITSSEPIGDANRNLKRIKTKKGKTRRKSDTLKGLIKSGHTLSPTKEIRSRNRAMSIDEKPKNVKPKKEKKEKKKEKKEKKIPKEKKRKINSTVATWYGGK